MYQATIALVSARIFPRVRGTRMPLSPLSFSVRMNRSTTAMLPYWPTAPNCGLTLRRLLTRRSARSWITSGMASEECPAETHRTMVGHQDFVSFAEVRGYHAILCRQDPQVCSGSVRAKSRWTSAPGAMLGHHEGLCDQLDLLDHTPVVQQLQASGVFLVRTR